MPSSFPVALGQKAELSVNNQPTTLGMIAERLLNYDFDNPASQSFFTERCQLDIGRYLFEQLFKGVAPDEYRKLPHEPVDLQIVTDDEPALRLPWNLLYAGRNFLTTIGWSISLRSPDVKPVEAALSPSPRSKRPSGQ